MSEYFVRWDGAYEATQYIRDYLSKNCSKIIIYEHPAKRSGKIIHCHAYIETERTDKTIREQIKKQHVLNGLEVAKGYCKKPTNSLIRLIAYMSRGKNDPHFNNGVPDIIVANGKSIGYDKDEEKDTENLEISQASGKRLTYFDIMEEAMTQYEDELLKEGYKTGDFPWHFNRVHDIVRNCLRKHRKLAHDE